MSRAPRYSKTQAFRIISLPNQLWQLQEYAPLKGGKGTKTFDPWKNKGLALELDKAVIVLQAIDATV